LSGVKGKYIINRWLPSGIRGLPESCRDIAAKGLLGKIIARHRIGSGPAAAADLQIFTPATIPFIPFEVPEFQKQFRIFPDVLEGRRKNIACGLGEITAGKNIAVHIDQADKLTSEAAFGTPG
jgi:hypothetical protein